MQLCKYDYTVGSLVKPTEQQLWSTLRHNVAVAVNHTKPHAHRYIHIEVKRFDMQ